MRIFGYTIIKTKHLNALKVRIHELECALAEAKKNDHRDSEGKYIKAPKRVRRHDK